jgi:hypothetical protein
MKKNIFTSKGFCLGFLAVAFVYGLILPFCWGNNPASELGTLSLLCEDPDKKIFFWIWGILTSGSIIANTQLLYSKYNIKSKVSNFFCILSFIGVCVVALTLGHSIDNWNPKRIAHWVATGVFIALTVAPILLFFLKNRKAHKQFTALALCTVAILMTFVVIFVFVGKSALMEMIPIALIEIFLSVVNFTKVIKEKELVKTA